MLYRLCNDLDFVISIAPGKFFKKKSLKMISCKRSADELINSSSYTRFIDQIPTWYHDLPYTVLLNIFKYFSENELLRNIIPVCQKWRYVAWSPLLWKKLTIKGRKVSLQEAMNMIRKLNNLETICCKNIEYTEAVIKQVCRCNMMISNLHFRNCNKISETSLFYLLNTCEMLQTLDLSGTTCAVRSSYLEQISTLQYLRSLNLSNQEHLTMRVLLTITLNCPFLEELRISWFPATVVVVDDDVYFMLSYLQNQLTVLSIDARSLLKSFNGIMQCYKLKKLGIYGAYNLDPKIFLRIRKNFSFLTVLKIRDAFHIDGKDVQELFTKGKDVLGKLTHIDFTGCSKITDEGITSVANCCPDLQILVLKSCKSLKDLSVLLHIPNIHTFNIAYCLNIDMQHLSTFGDTIKILTIDEEQAESDTIAKLRNQIKIYVDYCEYKKDIKELNKEI